MIPERSRNDDASHPRCHRSRCRDPTKHVDYQLGMVLGVDDFEQEFTYSSGRDKRIVRDLVGYGVVSGLRVTVDIAP